MSAEIVKTEWVIKAPQFGKRRIWKDGEGFFYVVHNMVYRDYDGAGDEIKVYKSERVTDIHAPNSLRAFRADASLYSAKPKGEG